MTQQSQWHKHKHEQSHKMAYYIPWPHCAVGITNQPPFSANFSPQYYSIFILSRVKLKDFPWLVVKNKNFNNCSYQVSFSFKCITLHG